MKSVRQIATSAAVLVLAAPAIAQIIPPPPAILLAPVQQTPTGGVFDYNYTTPNQSFVWDQYPAIRSPGSLLPTHFLFCLRRITDGPCTHATATHNLLPSAIPSALLRAPGSFSPVGYRYTFTPTVPDSKLDDVVGWQVAACTTTADASCMISARTWIVLATQDVQAVNISSNVIGVTYNIAGEARNRGTRTTREFRARLEGREALFDPVSEQCLTNPNVMALRNELTLHVVDNKGADKAFAALPRDLVTGDFLVSNVVAIYRPAPGVTWQSAVLEHLTLSPTAGMVPPPRTLLGSFPITLPAGRPRAYVQRLTVDSTNDIMEVREDDNTIAECELVR